MKFEARISAVLTFSRQEAEHLVWCCKHHYDAHIQSLAIPGDGAFVNGLIGQFWKPETMEADYSFTFRQIDSMAKAVEFYDTDLAAGMRVKFGRACARINAISVPLNELLDALA